MRIGHGSAAIMAALLLVLIPAGSVAFASSDPIGAASAALSAQENTNPNTNLGYLFAVYIITWAGFFAYIFIVSRRQRVLERQIDDLKELLGEKQSTEKG